MAEAAKYTPKEIADLYLKAVDGSTSQVELVEIAKEVGGGGVNPAGLSPPEQIQAAQALYKLRKHLNSVLEGVGAVSPTTPPAPSPAATPPERTPSPGTPSVPSSPRSPGASASSPAVAVSEAPVPPERTGARLERGEAPRARIDSDPKTAEREQLKNAARQRINEAWDELLRLETPTNKLPATDLYTKPYDRDRKNIHEAGILPLVREFFPSEVKQWELKRDIFDAFTKGCEAEGSQNQEPIVQLGWRNAIETRKKVTGQIGIEKLREFAHYPGFKDLVATAEKLFAEGAYKYFARQVGDQWVIVEPGTPGAVELKVNFAKDGNIGASGTPPASEGGKSFQEILVYEYVKTHRAGLRRRLAAEAGLPDENKTLTAFEVAVAERGLKAFDRNEDDHHYSVLDVTQFFVVIGELRLKHYAKYYESYAKTADPTYDITPLAHHAPLTHIGYKVRGYMFIPSELAMLWQVLRYPKQGGRFTRATPIPSDIDIDNKRKITTRNKKGEKVSVEDWDGEYLPETLAEMVAEGKPDVTHQMVDAIQVRNLIDLGLTKFTNAFEPVHVADDLTVFPFVWDIIFGDRNGYKDITFSAYNEAYTSWVDFVKKMSHPPSPDALQITDSFTAMASALAKLKGIATVMGMTEHGNAFIRIQQQVVLRYLKVIYDQYDEKSKKMPVQAKIETGSLTPKAFFFKQLRAATVGQSTLDPRIREFLLDLCNKNEQPSFRYGLFSHIRDDRTRPKFTIKLPFIGNISLPGKWVGYKALVERYVPSPEREEHAKKG